MITNIILGLIALSAVLFGGQPAEAPEMFGAATSTLVQSLKFFDELMPDGSTCSDGQILKRTGANDWDCAADETSAGAGSGTVVTSTAVTTGYFPRWGSVTGLTGTSTLFASSSRVGLGTISPSTTLDIIGDLRVSATTTVQGKLVDASGNPYTTSTGSGSVTTSTPITANHVPYWVTTGGGLAGTSTLSVSGTAVNASGTISQSGVAVALSNTTISAGGLLTGGGDLSTNRTITFTSSSLNLGTASIQNLSAFLQPSNNLSELTATSTARTNIGLGSVENTALSTWAGSGNITTLGTITSGTWTGTDVAVNAGGTGTSTAPFDLSILTGEGGAYAQKTLTAGSNITITTSTGAITIAGTGGGAGSVSTSSAITAQYFPFWATSTGGLSGTSTIYSSGTGSSARIGISTISPSSTLHVVGDSRFTATSTFLGNVGVGTTAPSTTLHVVGTFRTASTSTLEGNTIIGSSNTPSSTLHVIGTLTVSATTTVQGKLVDVSGNAYVTSTGGGSGTVSTSTAVTAGYFSTWGTTSALTGTSTIFASSTRVGIGTISPSSTLHVIGDVQNSGVVISSLGAVGAPTFTFGGDLNTGMWSSAADTLNFSTGGSERARFTSAGLLGVGTTAPSTTLHVVGGLQVTATTTLQGQTTIDDLYLGASSFANDAGQATWADLPVSTAVATSTVESYTARIDGNALMTLYSTAVGNGTVTNLRVGVNTTAPSSTFHVVGDALITATTTIQGKLVDTSGNAYVTSTAAAQYPIQFIIENPTATENNSIFTFRATSTITGCYGVNKSAGDTATINLGYSTSRATATSSLSKIFSSNQTITATTTPTSITINGSTTPGTANNLVFFTTAASSTQLTLTCYYTTP